MRDERLITHLVLLLVVSVIASAPSMVIAMPHTPWWAEGEPESSFSETRELRGVGAESIASKRTKARRQLDAQQDLLPALWVVVGRTHHRKAILPIVAVELTKWNGCGAQLRC
jgi:hypothetical protein